MLRRPRRNGDEDMTIVRCVVLGKKIYTIVAAKTTSDADLSDDRMDETKREGDSKMEDGTRYCTCTHSGIPPGTRSFNKVHEFELAMQHHAVSQGICARSLYACLSIGFCIG